MKKWRTILNFTGQRVATFYVFVFLIFYFTIDLSKAKMKAMVETLNRYRPEFIELVDFVENNKPLDEKNWNQYLKYYRVAEKVLPYHPGVHGIQGYCYYQVGKNKKAIKSLMRAVELNPYFFWFQYNLGIIYYKQEQYAKAKESLTKALTSAPMHNILFYSASKSYLAIIQHSALDQEEQLSRLKLAYANTLKLLALISYAERDSENFSRYIHEGIRKNDSDHEFVLLGGIAHVLGKDYKEALNFLLRYIRYHPDDAVALQFIIKSFQELGRPDLAKQFIERAKKVDDKGGLMEKGKRLEPQIY